MAKPKKKQYFVSTVVDRSQWEKMRRLAKKERRTVAAMIRRIVDELPEEEVQQATGS
jgi:hypothetical protein